MIGLLFLAAIAAVHPLLFAVLLMMLMLVWLVFQSMHLAAQECPHCGKTGVSIDQDARGGTMTFVCDHCQRRF